MPKRLRRVWRNVARRSMTPASWKSLLSGKDSEGKPLPEGWLPEPRTEDPPLASQFLPYVGKGREERWEAYMRAVQLAPGASEGTKAKWRRRLAL